MTGNHNLTQLHLDTALGQCQTYILLNHTAVNEHPDVTTVIVNLCPNNCSNRGVCSSGKHTQKEERLHALKKTKLKSSMSVLILKDNATVIMDLEEAIVPLTCYLHLQ